MADATPEGAVLARLRHMAPGEIPTGFSEAVLAQSEQVEDPAVLYDAATTLGALAQKWNSHGREKREIKAAQMFVEIELGQRLGPRPGSRWGRESTFACESIPPPRVSELQRYLGHREPLVEAVRNGAVSRRSLLTLVEGIEREGRPDPVEVDIRRGEFQSVLSHLEPGSVDLILTDPPYPREYLYLWDELGEFAADKLVDGGSLVTYCGQSILPDALNALDKHLRYWWTICAPHRHGNQMLPGKFVSVGWKPVLWFVKGGRRSKLMLPDVLPAGGAPRKTVPTGDGGAWAQAVDELKPIIEGLTAPGDLVVDPFAGSGTTGFAVEKYGRRFIGAEIAG
jgi:hypothetical protein